MAILQPITAGDRPPAEEPLSGFERRCLHQRIAGCHESIQIALLGADHVKGKAPDDPTFRAIQAELCIAEAAIARAESIAGCCCNHPSHRKADPRPKKEVKVLIEDARDVAPRT